ncbi:MAG: hypothetical protein ABIT01_20430, partial [Thermoanaerobaculia bacterium]
AVMMATATLVSCGGDPFGAPVRVKTHGYRAVVKSMAGSKEARTQLAVRGEDRRREPEEGQVGNIFIWKGAERRAYELDPLAKTVAERPFTSIDEALPGHPLTPGFSDQAESARRGVVDYHRESDVVYAGHVCWLWRFDDKPGDPLSPSTTYWVAPDLDRLVLRVVREAGPGTPPISSSELMNVRAGASADLFVVPAAYRRLTAAR